jgi:PAS domain-containing protein
MQRHLLIRSPSGPDSTHDDRTSGAAGCLEASERRLRALVANAFDGIAVLDAAGLLTFASPPLCKVLGRAEREILGRPGLDFVEPVD